LILSNGSDWTRNTPRIEYPYIRKVYGLYKAEHKIENVHFPAERHDYGFSKRKVLYNFIAHHLRLSSQKITKDNSYNEDFVKILKKKDLLIFNKMNPPVDALRGEEEIIRYLNLKL
jgi:hypothetical protein